MDSPEKVARLQDQLRRHRPDDEESARQLQTLTSLAPLLKRFLPSDPAELDRYLGMLAQGAVSCRSDDAPVLAVHAWNPTAGAWEVFEP